MNMKLKHLLAAALLLAAGAPAFAQSNAFKLGKWTEIQNALLKELSRSYVDTLPVDRIERAGINAMLEDLDPYTVYIPEEENEDLQMMINKTYGGVGAIIYKPDKNGNIIITEPYAGSPAAKAGLVCGDEILAIDGATTHGLTSQDGSEKMRGKPGTTVTLKVLKLRTKDTVDVPIVRERIHLPDVEYAGMLDDTTGYILQTGFTENVSSDVRNAFLKLKGQGMKKLVLDLRSNGGGLLGEAVNIVGMFVPKGSLVVSSKGLANGSNSEMRTLSEPLDMQIPIVVMVNSASASASEIVSGALQDMDRATIIGERTFGKGLVQSIRPLPYNGQLKVTTAKYYTPSGRCVQAIDYARRNEDGSVGHIPDSLTHEFKTAHGRTVRDGGGITPDVRIKSRDYSRLTYSLVMNGIVEQYALEYVRKHPTLEPVVAGWPLSAEELLSRKAGIGSHSSGPLGAGTRETGEFFLSDEAYADFVAFAKTRNFDYRSSARTLFDQMKKELEKDGLTENMKDELNALQKVLEMDKETFLHLKKAELVPFIEEEIAVRYWFQEAGIKIRLRYDDQLREALAAPLISY